jgi:hypothetical protein
MKNLDPRPPIHGLDWLPRPRNKYRPATGRNIDIQEIEATDRYETSRTRDHLAKVIVWGGAAALLIAAMASYGQHSFAPTAAV